MKPRIHAPNEFRKKYSSNKYSQNGEDGLLNEICKRIGLIPIWVCEFGAWDGKYLSNTFEFIETGTTAVLIEPVKYKDLEKTAKEYPSIYPICAMISHTNDATKLDTLLATTPIPYDFEILSLDIDGEDYHIWESLTKYNPKIVIIEINSLIHPENKDYIHSSRNGCLGSGFGATLELGKRKGYTFVCHTGNMIFIRNDLYSNLNLSYENPIENFDASWYNGER